MTVRSRINQGTVIPFCSLNYLDERSSSNPGSLYLHTLTSMTTDQ